MKRKIILTVLVGIALLVQTSLASAFYLNLNTQANSIADLGTALSVTTGTVVLDPNNFSSTASASLSSPYGTAFSIDAQTAPNLAYAQASVYDLNHQFDAIGQVMNTNPNADLTLIGTDGNVFGNAAASYKQFFTINGAGTVQYDGWYSVLKDIQDLTGANEPIHARWNVLFTLGNTRTGLSTSASDSEDYFINAFSSGRAGGDFVKSLYLPGFANGDQGYVYAYASTDVVPEPGTFLLVGVGLAGCALYRRRNSEKIQA
ncbi:PEP-CTERM sorting domain-containing protein [Geobacter argillaceus]|uniref:Putative secreted protein with PEP-CTERM sorting signal n=1 Tax=Geobacter argillaceus TaxID=345631 RepID=A0A562VKJ8_9BACT|nr:PEP-CTERM sorting domain-containing protein [Geobacter argillaceus]TWJ18400.1 putative secreted protein with PEP-CTERM sorting signal [Geobacter argillaceus]